MKATFISEFLRGVRQGPRLFFAPLIGAVRGVRLALRRIERENARHEAELQQTERH